MDNNPEDLPACDVKCFAASELPEQVEDWTRLAKVAKRLNQHRQMRNAARKKHLPVLLPGQS
jgi:hypothetical protein